MTTSRPRGKTGVPLKPIEEFPQPLFDASENPIEPIMCVLEAESPLGEYRKITEEIVKRMPDESRYPRAAAEAVRSFLLLRLGLHLGLRQKNLWGLVANSDP